MWFKTLVIAVHKQCINCLFMKNIVICCSIPANRCYNHWYKSPVKAMAGGRAKNHRFRKAFPLTISKVRPAPALCSRVLNRSGADGDK